MPRAESSGSSLNLDVKLIRPDFGPAAVLGGNNRAAPTSGCGTGPCGFHEGR
jgi:hypothetical protein